MTDKFLNCEYWQTATIDDVKQEIANGVDVNAQDEYGYTVLIFASMSADKTEIIKTLVELGADVNAENMHGETPLMYAEENNDNPEIAKTLKELGAK